MSSVELAWGRLRTIPPASVRRLSWRNEPLPIADGETVLPHGLGRSYGDSCLNPGGVLLDTTGLDHLIAFDAETGDLECEAGLSLAAILDFAVPRGWFLPVVPGTKFVTVGGAIANDVHGKNHHRSGTFGAHVSRFLLRRSNGELLDCSPSENLDLFAATIGGLGLTGLILSATVRLRRFENELIEAERKAFVGLDEFFLLSDESDARFEYTVGWIDVAARPGDWPGVLIRGNQAPVPGRRQTRVRRQISIPLDLPTLALNRWSVALFNRSYRRAQMLRAGVALEHYDPFFFPLDALANWNRLYGNRGFYQYQCVVPHSARDVLAELLRLVARSGEVPFLSVLKVFGAKRSPGTISFPRPGPTLALDFPNRGQSTLRLFERLDELVVGAGGAVYPAKDARMSADTFRRSFPRWQEFSALVDPAFSSSFWRRVHG